MAIYNLESKLSDILMIHPDLIPVVSRLGVSLGVGDFVVREICESHGIDAPFFLSVINTFIDPEYFPVNSTDIFSLGKTVDYLDKTSDYYSQVQLPNIERHFHALIKMSRGDNNLSLLQHFFLEMKNQFSETIVFEKSQLYPALRNNDFSKIENINDKAVNTEVEERLQDLLTFFVAHLKGDYDKNLCMAVVISVFSLYNDVCQNNRIRKRILLPLIDNLPKQKVQ